MTFSRDLADHHFPVSSLFTQPATTEEWEAYSLTKEQIDHYRELGYVSGIRLLEEWQVDRLREEVELIRDPEHPSHDLFYEFHSNESTDPNAALFHSLGHWRITRGFHDVLWNPAFVKAASQLLENRPVRFWHDQLFCKPAHHGGVVAWHQDYSYWTRTIAMQHLTCWVALDDADKENGCLYYVPGSHRWGLLEKPELAGEMEGLMNYMSPEQKEAFRPVPIEIRKGCATFHHPLMVHGSHRNTSSKPRRAFVLNVFADGTISNTDDELLKGVPHIPRGEKIKGKFFPLLYQPGLSAADNHQDVTF
jgi:hypothetical protein